MQIRIIQQKTKRGTTRKYAQLVTSVRRADGLPVKKVIAHLGPYDPVLHENMKHALKASRENIQLGGRDKKGITLECSHNLIYLPFALVSLFFDRFGLDEILNALAPPPRRATSVAKTVEALVAHRCLAPGSKLSFQRWITRTAVNEIISTPPHLFNNTRIHRVMDELAAIDSVVQDQIRQKIVAQQRPRILYLDLTDTWFEAGGGSLSRRGRTKAGHRSKRKIHIALMVNEQGLPLRWQVLTGALSETTVLPQWLPFLKDHMELSSSILIFDRGMPSAENFQRLVDPQQGALFLTSIKSDSIPTYVTLDNESFFQFQELFDKKRTREEREREMQKQLRELGFQHFKDKTYTRDLGIVTPPVPSTKRQTRPPKMRMYLYFNRDIHETKSRERKGKIDKVYTFVKELNEELKHVKQPRKEKPTRRKVERVIEKLSLTELFAVNLRPHAVQGKTKKLNSFQIELTFNQKMYRYARRYDGMALLVGHPDLKLTIQESIQAYRQKDVVETDFRTIKSVLKIRPTWHWTDCKIKSHVTICVLSLLVERLIEQELKKDENEAEYQNLTAPALLEELDAVRLNRIRVEKRDYCIRTKENKRIKEVLKCLDALNVLEQFRVKETIS